MPSTFTVGSASTTSLTTIAGVRANARIVTPSMSEVATGVSPAVSGTLLRAKIVQLGRDGYVCLYEVRGRMVLVARLLLLQVLGRQELANP